MSTYTCITCRVAFDDADLQRSHYKSDWHRYNLKRKVVDLPSVTATNFQQRVLAQQQQVESPAIDSSSHCSSCNKHFGSYNQYQNHINSKKHKELADKQSWLTQQTLQDDLTVVKNEKNAALKKLCNSDESQSGPSDHQSTQCGKNSEGESPKLDPMQVDDEAVSDDGSWESWEGVALALEECLFCSHTSRTLEKNMRHMMISHSFFVPDMEYISDLEGLITYLGEKVGEGHICLWCNTRSKAFRSVTAVQQHMVDKGHCKLLNDGDAVLEYADYYDYRSSYPDYDKDKDDNTEGASETCEKEVDTEVLDGDSYQLVLPSGSVIGHRSLARYYRQKLGPDRQVALRSSCVSRVMAQYKALGWTGSAGAVAQRRAKDLSHFHRIKHHKYLHLGVKANKLQHHYREQVIY